jgi:hypothetical protein
MTDYWEPSNRPAGERNTRPDPWQYTQPYEPVYTEPLTRANSPYPPVWDVVAPPPPELPARPRRRHIVRNVALAGVLVCAVLGALAAIQRGPNGIGTQSAPPTFSPTATSTPAASFSATLPYNNVGISDDAAPQTANFDGLGNSYSAEALSAVGLVPGKPVVFNGVRFVWPAAAPGTNDDMQVNGQTIPVRANVPFSTLAFLGAAQALNTQFTITIVYTDGTKQSAQIGLTNWTLPFGLLQFSDATVAVMHYRNTKSKSKASQDVYVFYVDVPLQSGKIMKSIQFPQTGFFSQVHIFSMGVKQ